MTQQRNPSQQLRNVLREDETLEWFTRPHKAYYLISSVIGGCVGFGCIAVFLMPFLGVFAYKIIGGMLPTLGSGPFITMLVSVAMGTIIFLFVFSVCLALISYRHKEYAVTNERLIEFGGIIGRDLTTVRWDKVQDLEVQTGIFTKWYDAGVISIYTAAEERGGDRSADLSMNGVEKPYEVLKTLERLRDSYESD